MHKLFWAIAKRAIALQISCQTNNGTATARGTRRCNRNRGTVAAQEGALMSALQQAKRVKHFVRELHIVFVFMYITFNTNELYATGCACYTRWRHRTRSTCELLYVAI